MGRHHLVTALAVASCLVAFTSAPARAADAESMQKEIDQAAAIIERFRDMPEQGIPDKILKDAKGIAILTVLKAGFIFSGQGGWGVVVARTGKGWSPPSAIGTGGAGFGFQVGAEVTEFVLVLNTPEAVAAFAHGGNVSFGGALSAAAGPVGRTLGAGVMPVAAVYTYSRAQGVFAGVSIEGTVIAERKDANRKYYGRSVTPREILSGKVKAPKGTASLRRALGNV